MSSTRLLVALCALAVSAPGLAAALPVPPQDDVLVGRISVKQSAAGWIGVKFVPVDTGDSARVLVSSVYPESPAGRAGLRAGDRVLEVNGARVSFAIIESLGPRIQPGDPYTFTILRDGRDLRIPVVAEERPAQAEVLVRGIQTQLDTLRTLIALTLDSLESLPGVPQLHVRTEEMGDGTVALFVSAQSHADPRAGPTATATGFVGRTLEWVDAEHFASARLPRDSTRAPAVFTVDASEVVPVPPFPGEAVGRLRTGDASAWTITSPLTPYVEGAKRVAGAELHRVGPDLGRYLGVDRGLLVTEVAPGTPAARTGLRSGDVVRAVNGASVTSLDQLRRLLAVPGEVQRLEVVRRGATLELQLRR